MKSVESASTLLLAYRLSRIRILPSDLFIRIYNLIANLLCSARICYTLYAYKFLNIVFLIYRAQATQLYQSREGL